MSADRTDVNIRYEGNGWLTNAFTADYDDVSVSFHNHDTTRACRVCFKIASTFGTEFVGLAPKGTISLNILVRNPRTIFRVRDLGQDCGDAGASGGETIVIDS